MGSLNEVNISTYAYRFDIVAEDYNEISIQTLPFSVRVINSFMRNGIRTLDMLLNSTPEDLMKIRGFGKSCLDEIDQYCHSLSNSDTPAKEANKSNRKPILPVIKTHKTNISLGDFSFVEEENLSESECLAVKNYEVAFEALGSELVLDCVVNPQKVAPLIDMFSKYQNEEKRPIDVWRLAYDIPKFRLNNKAQTYIRTFTASEDKRNLLYEMCPSEDSTILDMLNYENLEDNSIFVTFKAFLNWCSFDLSKEIDNVFEKLYTKQSYSDVIRMRAERKTLEEIGSLLGVTRERIRQIEAKIKRKFHCFNEKNKIISKISADRNGDTIITPLEIAEYCNSNHKDLVYLLQFSESPNYTYDKQLDAFILGSDSLKERINNFIEGLPDIIKASNLKEFFDVAEESGIDTEILEKAFLDSYRCTGEVYHRHRLSLAAIYEKVLDKHYPNGLRVYDPEEIAKFRQVIFEEYGDVGLPEHDRALTARVSSICVLCGRGMYKPKSKSFISKNLSDKIYQYIKNSDSSIFLTNTLFATFENELVAEGIDNKYYLQGVLRELFEDKFYFKRDYISKDFNVSSFYSEVVSFIKGSEFPVSKQEIYNKFPGITEIIINISTDDPDILNYFGEYLHASKLHISSDEKSFLYTALKDLVSDGNTHHSHDIYNILFRENPEIFTRNAALYPFGVYSILEYLFRDKFQFIRPYVAKNDAEISPSAERLHDFIYNQDEITISHIRNFSNENHFYIQSLLEYVDGCNDEFLLINESTIMKIEKTGIDKSIANQVEDIISSAISETTPVKNLSIWAELPTVNVPWTEWLIYSVITKWGTKLLAATSSNQFKRAVPLVAPVDNYDPTAFKDIDKDVSSISFVADDLSDIDSLLEEIIGDDFLDNF